MSKIPSSPPGKQAATTSFQEVESVIEAAEAYDKMSWVVVPSIAGGKGSHLAGWSTLEPHQLNLQEHFAGDGGVAILLGPSGLVDVDLDSPVAIALAPSFLPSTGFVFGHGCSDARHYVFSSPDAAEIKQLSLNGPSGQGMLLELRSGKKLLDCPPSAHPDGDIRQFSAAASGVPSVVPIGDLESAFRRLAVACGLATIWPKYPGHRQDFALAAAGGLLNAKFTAEEAQHMIIQAARYAGDSEYMARGTAAQSTYQKKCAGEATTGWPAAIDLIGSEEVAVLEQILTMHGSKVGSVAQKSIVDLILTTEQLAVMEVEEPKTVLGNWMHQGTITLIYGHAKSNKTWLSMAIADAVSAGGSILGWNAPFPLKALFLEGEMRRSEVKQRFGEIGPPNSDLSVLPSESFHEKGRPKLNLTKLEDQAAVTEAIEALGIEFLIVDALTSLAPRPDENDNSSAELQSFIEWLTRLKHSGITVLLVHHSGHSGRNPRGASSLTGFVDTIVALKKDPTDKTKFIVDFTATRGLPPSPSRFAVRMTADGDFMNFAVSGDGDQPKYQVLKLMVTSSFKTQKEIAAECGVSAGTMSGWCKALKAEGLLEKKGLKLTLEGKKKGNELLE